MSAALNKIEDGVRELAAELDAIDPDSLREFHAILCAALRLFEASTHATG